MMWKSMPPLLSLSRCILIEISKVTYNRLLTKAKSMGLIIGYDMKQILCNVLQADVSN